MIALALWALALAAGRMTRHLTFLQFAIALVASGILALVISITTSELYLGTLAFHLAIMAVLFVVGHAVGRWLDRDKYYE